MKSGILHQVLKHVDSLDKEILQKKEKNQDQDVRYHRLRIWTRGFRVSLDELEQSIYCCQKWGSLLNKKFEDEMHEEELMNYHRYIYFYKNAIIRLFSLLDKMGYFLNDLYNLRTEKIKTHFSYFTVLRRMGNLQKETDLQKKLLQIKIKNRALTNKLRKQRNTEIHWMNAEMLDDFIESHPYSNDRIQIEDHLEQLTDLQQSFEMVCQVMLVVFSYHQKMRFKKQ